MIKEPYSEESQIRDAVLGGQARAPGVRSSLSTKLDRGRVEVAE